MPKYIPTPAYPGRMPVDISFVFEKERPAGKHGFLTVDGDHFRFEDGTRLKFFGVCLSGSANFPEHDYAEQLAERLAQAGVNCVRTHWMDSDFNTPNIFAFTKGPRLTTTRKLDPRSMDRLDYIVKCLKERGIYIYLDNITFRKFRSGDGVPFAEELDNAAKPYVMFDRRLIDLQKEYITQLWTHKNPYTGKAYKDEPAVVLTEVINETDLFYDSHRLKSDYYEKEWRSLYRDYLAAHELVDDWENVDLYGADEPLRSFKIELTENYFREIRDHLRSLGVRIPVNGSNWYHHSIYNLVTQEEMDFTDAHHYYYDWCWNEDRPICANVPINGYPYTFPHTVLMKTNKPFFVSEWDVPMPNDYRAEGAIYYPAIAALQDCDGIGIFAYQQGRDPQKIDTLGSEMSTFNLGGYPFEAGVLSCWNDPAKFGLFYHGALLVRRGDLEPAKKKIAVLAKGPKLIDQKAYQTGTELHRLFTVLNEKDAAGADETVPDSTAFEPGKDGDLISDHGQWRRYMKDRVTVIDTPRSKIVFGMLARNRKGTPSPRTVLDGVTFRAHTDWGVIALSSLTDDEISKTDNMLLSAIGRASNSDPIRNGDQTIDPGHPPIISEVITAEVEIKTERRDLIVHAVNPEGYYTGRIPATWENGVLKFTIGEEFAASYYLIQAE